MSTGQENNLVMTTDIIVVEVTEVFRWGNGKEQPFFYLAKDLVSFIYID